jgi:predicted nucleic acid-binding protein
MIVVIQDANILIDLADVGLLNDFFRLDVEAHTTDLVLHEVKSSDVDRFVQVGVLKKETFDVAELTELVEFKGNRPTLSLQDCSVLKLAMRRKATLLTGDGALRKHAIAENVSVHGILWIFDRMISRRIMKPQDAAKHLRQLMKKNPRLPADECKKRLSHWTGK